MRVPLARLITLPEACMRYLAELYYLQDQREFPFRKAVTATATVVAQWCDYFYARIIAPTTKQVKPLERSGSLPKSLQEKEAFVVELLNWLFENSITDELFCLLMDDKPVPQAGVVSKFDHHDDTCCWVLNLDDNQFSELQTKWREQGLPEDLFYPESKTLCAPYPVEGMKSKLLRALRVRKCYTPKQWENEFLSVVASKKEAAG
jgi:hypothetical protein